MSATLIKLSFDVLHATGLANLGAPFFRGRGIIFCLHQVYPGGGNSAGFTPNHQLAIDPAFLDAALHEIKHKGYRLISLDEAVSELTSNTKPAAPFAVFTLDDGYRDNARHAAPIFRQHGCPYTIYVAPRIAEGTCELWWLALEKVIAQNTSVDVELPGVARRFDISNPSGKNVAARTLFPVVKHMDEYEQRRWIRKFCAQYAVNVDDLCRELAMTWDELRDLSKDPLCTIGAHTLNHYALKKLNAADAKHEMEASAQNITQELRRPVRHFAFPYGDKAEAGPREFSLAAAAGFTSAVVTRKGVIHDGHANHLHALPRVMLSGRYQKLRYVKALLTGTPLALLNGLRKIDVN